MSNHQLFAMSEDILPLLPYGETLRPLIVSSGLSDADLKHVLNKRGIFGNFSSKKETIPTLVSILLSPKEFDLLKNRHSFKESTVKTSDSKAAWHSDRTIVQAIPNEIEKIAQDLIEENSPIQLENCRIDIVDQNQIVINCSIKRQDWTKDVFSQTTSHECKLTIKKEQTDNTVVYYSETTASETKFFINKLQSAIHKHFCRQKDIQNPKVQRIFAHKFIYHEYRFEFLEKFTQPSEYLIFQKFIDIDAGIDHESSQFPQDFKWLQGNINKISLAGERLGDTDIILLGRKGILIVGEIQAEFRFDLKKSKGTCVIKYGFPAYYESRKDIEFEVKIVSLQLHANFSHVPKKQVEKDIVKEFQAQKHFWFEEFEFARKVSANIQIDNQYAFEELIN